MTEQEEFEFRLRLENETAAPAAPAEGSRARAQKQSEGILGKAIANVLPGLVRGAGSIGATLMAPIDMASDALAGKGLSLASNRERRAGIDAGLAQLGADPTDPGYRLGKVGAEVAGTMGVGGVMANTAAHIPGAAVVAPNLLQAIRTGGMTAGGATGVANPASRVAGGAITGGPAAGLVDPEQAKTGALIGGALPVAAQLAGRAGNAIGRTVRGPQQPPDLANAIAAARSAGYIIPPSQANPTLVNRVLEGAAGKITTAQNASARNAGVTSKLVAKDLGLAADTKITPDVLKGLRDTAGRSYQAIGATGTITPGAAYAQALDAIEAPFLKAAQAFPSAKPSPVVDLVESLRSPAFDAAAAVEKIKQLRTAADDAFRAGNTDVARASRAGAAALEDAIESHLQTIGQAPLLQQFRDARQLIAKTYSAEKALNPATGGVDARGLAAQLKRGKPLSGGMKEAAEFAARFPKAAQTVEGMGSLPQISPLDWMAAGGLSAATSNPLAMAAIGLRPAARAAVLSPLVQNRLIQGAGMNPIQALLANQELQQLGYRAAPTALSDR